MLRDLAVLAWPGPCFHCGGPLGPIALAGACLECWAELDPAPRRVHGGTTGGGDPPIRGALTYEGFAVAAHRRLKFEGATELAVPLARFLLAARSALGADVEAFGHVLAVPPDPLRLPPRRWAAHRLAQAFAHLAGLPSAPRGWLRRRHAGPSQTAQTAAARRASLRGAFVSNPEEVRGRAILLVDDVTTTGTTLERAREALRAAKASRVEAWALAETPARS